MQESAMDKYLKHETTGEMPYSCFLQIIGKPCVLYTNSPKLQEVVSEFFRNPVSLADFIIPVMSLRFYVQETASEAPKVPVETVASLSHFRGFGPYVFATYGPDYKMCFNLLDREVTGVFPSSALQNEELWRRTILPVLVGIMACSLGTVALHSACLVYEGKGILISGHSGAGKSTLSVALAKKGLALLSDDWTYLSEEDGRQSLWGLPIPIKLLPDATRFFPELDDYLPACSLNGETAYEVDPERVFHCQRSLHCTPSCFLLLERSEVPYTTFEPIGIEEIVSYFADGLEELPEMLGHLRGPQIELIRGLSRCRLFRMRVHGDPDTVAGEVVEFCQAILSDERGVMYDTRSDDKKRA